MIHGPPGTGKTKTLAKLASILVENPLTKILITSPSNVGVDNLISAIRSIVGSKTNIVRVGNPSRADADIQEFLFDNLLKKKLKEDGVYKKMLMELELVKRKIAKLKTKIGFAHKAEIKQKKNEFKQFQTQIADIEMSAMNSIIQDSSIIAATLSSIYDRKLQTALLENGKNKKLFDVVIIDEAGQALNYLLFIAIIHAKRVVFAGDHKQLPPTIKSKENEKKHTTLFEQLTGITKNVQNAETFSTMLKCQYRMHENIMRISSQFMYNDSLMADVSVREKLLELKPRNQIDDSSNPVLTQNVSLVFVNTFGNQFGENDSKPESFHILEKSKYNLGEAELVAFFLLVLKQHYNIAEKDIGVITPYSAQVDAISRKLEKMEEDQYIGKGVIVSTVDGFQGKEKEVIIISTVRSNKAAEIGFLSDIRRMNVAITRAKKMLILIGDENTIQKNEFLGFILAQIKSNGATIKIDDIENESVGNMTFKKEEFYMSGVFQAVCPKTEGIISVKKNQEPEKKKIKSKNSNKDIKKNENTEVLTECVDDGLNEYWKEFLDQFLFSNKAQTTIFRKIENNEFEKLKVLCDQQNLILSKSKKQTIISKLESNENIDSTKNEQIENILENKINFSTNKNNEIEKTKKIDDFIEEKVHENVSSSNLLPNKRKKSKKVKMEEAEVQDESEIADQFFKEYTLKREICHFVPQNSEIICGKNIKILFNECRFCFKFFCVQHSLAETHGCGDSAREEARDKHQKSFKPKLESFDENLIKEKLQKKLLEAQKNRQPKLKTKK